MEKNDQNIWPYCVWKVSSFKSKLSSGYSLYWVFSWCSSWCPPTSLAGSRWNGYAKLPRGWMYCRCDGRAYQPGCIPASCLVFPGQPLDAEYRKLTHEWLHFSQTGKLYAFFSPNCFVNTPVAYLHNTEPFDLFFNIFRFLVYIQVKWMQTKHEAFAIFFFQM